MVWDVLRCLSRRAQILVHRCQALAINQSKTTLALGDASHKKYNEHQDQDGHLAYLDFIFGGLFHLIESAACLMHIVRITVHVLS